MHLAELFGGIADKLRVRGQTEEQIQVCLLVYEVGGVGYTVKER